MAVVGGVRAPEGGPRPQALRQPARRRPEDGAAAGARGLHPAPGRRERVDRALRPDRRVRPGGQGDVLRPDGGQGVPPPDLLRAAARSRPHVKDLTMTAAFAPLPTMASTATSTPSTTTESIVVTPTP